MNLDIIDFLIDVALALSIDALICLVAILIVFLINGAII